MFTRRPLPPNPQREAHVVFVTRLVVWLLIAAGALLLIKGCPAAIEATVDVLVGP